MTRPLLDRDLIYVTGKGGVGKTTVAAAIGLAAAAQGRTTIVCEVAEQHHMSRAFAHAGVGRDHEARLADGLYAITVDPQHALEEWLSRQVGGSALKVLTRSSAFQYFVAAAPGAKELITIAKVWELAQGHRWTKTNRTYDLVVVDAPASGHGVAMLQTPKTFGDIARVGPIQRQAYKVRDMLADPDRTGYVAVALPEEMPVNETLQLQDKVLDATGLDLDLIVVNGLYPERFSREEADRLHDVAANDGYAAEEEAALRAALAADARARDQRSHLRRLRRDARAPVSTLPFVFDTELALDDYRTMAERLARRLTA
jgi:anion-transporting  ArsA/GET3 family ATPase